MGAALMADLLLGDLFLPGVGGYHELWRRGQAQRPGWRGRDALGGRGRPTAVAPRESDGKQFWRWARHWTTCKTSLSEHWIPSISATRRRWCPISDSWAEKIGHWRRQNRTIDSLVTSEGKSGPDVHQSLCYT